MIALLLLVGIPCLLNCFLQVESPLKRVIGGENAPKDWLFFWGSYLSAIGASAAAIVALYNSKKERRSHYLLNRVKELDDIYRDTEEAVKRFEMIHSKFRLYSIVVEYEDNPSKAILSINDYSEKELKSATFFVQKQQKDSLYPKYKSYFEALFIINSAYIELVSQINETMVAGLGENKKEIVEKINKIIHSGNKERALEQSTHLMYEEGWKLLGDIGKERLFYYRKLKEESISSKETIEML